MCLYVELTVMVRIYAHGWWEFLFLLQSKNSLVAGNVPSVKHTESEVFSQKGLCLGC